MKKILLFVFALILTHSLSAQQTYTSTSAVNNNWSNSGNWNPVGIPAVNDTAIINSDISVDATTTIAKLTVIAGNTLNINNALTVINSAGESSVSGTVVVINDFIISDGDFSVGNGGLITVGSGRDFIFSSSTGDTFTNNGTVTVSSNATSYGALLFPSGTVSGSGAFQYKLYLPAKSAAWDLAGAPVTGQTVQNFMTNNSNLATNGGDEFIDERGIGPFTNSDHDFTTWTYTEASGQNFTAGKGFQMASEGGSTVTFQGTVNTSTVQYTITSNETAVWNNNAPSRFELLSNPFPAYMSLNSNADSNNNWLSTNLAELSAGVHKAVWAWNGSSYVTYTQSDNATYLAPGQGFFVGADGHSGQTGTIDFNPLMLKQTSNTNGFYDVMDDTRADLFLNIFQNEDEIFTKIFFLENGTDGIDEGYDGAAFIYNMPLSIYSRPVDQESQNDPITGQINNLGSQTLSYTEMWDKVIPLGINALGGEEMTISISHRTTPADLNIYLEDAQEGTMTNLLEEDFVLTPTSDFEGVGRFFIHMTADTMSNEEVSTSMLNAYKEVNANYITLEGLATQSNNINVSLYNILGRKVLDTSLSNNMNTQTISTLGMAAGIYVIELESGSDRLTKKLIIQ